MQDIVEVLRGLASRYPESFRERVLADVPRQAFLIGLVRDAVELGGRVMDVGGGTSLFAPGCAALGYHAALIDDFLDFSFDPAVCEAREEMLENIHAPLAVEVIQGDLIDNPDCVLGTSVDCVASFDVIEHVHHSPRRLFRNLATSLKSGGLFLLGAPNCVNLRKRLSVPLGRGSWSSMHEWYEQDDFRGHVREPCVEDLIYVVRDLGLERAEVYGRNWKGLANPRGWFRAAARLADPLLQMRPSLCSDIYVAAHKVRG